MTFKMVRSLRTTFTVAPFDGKHLISYLMAVVMFAFVKILYNMKYSLHFNFAVFKSGNFATF